MTEIKTITEEQKADKISQMNRFVFSGSCFLPIVTGIGGLDTNVYRHTSQEDKADIIFYCESD